MGHSQSQPIPRSVRRKPSTILSHLACATASSSTLASIPSRETSEFLLVNEKSSYREHEDTRRPTEAAYAYRRLSYLPPKEILSEDDAAMAYDDFLREFPEYRLTWILDTLRRTDFTRLKSTGETYADYMGGAIYPESLIRVHTDFLHRSVLGNTHSVSNSSKLSLNCADEARAAVLSFFRAPSEYTVVFTTNATGALKLVGESFPFSGGSTYVLSADSHNSVHGIREFATARGSRICYIPCLPHGGIDPALAKNILLRNRPRYKDLSPSLFALTGQSNITNSKSSLSLIEYASSLGYNTILDAAALAPTSVVSLEDTPVDAMAVSFYKMFGFPTGVGALVVKKSFLAQLKRPWFAGGTVDVVQVPGTVVTRSPSPHEQFEDGTINYLTLPAVTDGLRFLSAYLPFLPLRLTTLLHYVISSLTRLRHDTTGTPVVCILSRTPSKRLRSVGEQADTGSIISLIFLSPSGEMIPNTFVEHAASQHKISLRTGCMCNPGGAAAILNIQDDMKQLYAGVTRQDFENLMGRELGVVRISLGLASNFYDAWQVIRFATLMSNERTREVMWDQWTETSSAMIGQAI